MRLMASNLELIDAEGAPAYLESSNARNEPRYESVGFAGAGRSRRLTGGARS